MKEEKEKTEKMRRGGRKRTRRKIKEKERGELKKEQQYVTEEEGEVLESGNGKPFTWHT